MILTLCSLANHAKNCSFFSTRPETPLAGNSSLSITLNKPKVITNGIFRKNTLKMRVFTEPLGWKVVRTFDDFKWLHGCLKNRFPGNYIPELPEAEASESSKDEDLFYLETYLNHVIKSQDLLYSPELSSFLKLNEKDFPRARGVGCLDKTPTPVYFKKPKDILDFNQNKPIDLMATPKGYVEMDMNPGVKKISKDIDKLVNNCYENNKAAEALCSDIGYHLDKAGELSERLARYMGKINQDYAEYFEHNKITPVVEIGQIYESASALLENMGNTWRKTAKSFAVDMQRMFDFANYENSGLQRLIELRNSFSETYEEAKINLEKKKAVLFEQKDLRRWGVDSTKLKVKAENLFANPAIANKYMLPQVAESYVGNHQRQKPSGFCRVFQQATLQRAGYLQLTDAQETDSLLREFH